VRTPISVGSPWVRKFRQPHGEDLLLFHAYVGPSGLKATLCALTCRYRQLLDCQSRRRVGAVTATTSAKELPHLVEDVGEGDAAIPTTAHDGLEPLEVPHGGSASRR
jgi:hypothetical protein